MKNKYRYQLHITPQDNNKSFGTLTFNTSQKAVKVLGSIKRAMEQDSVIEFIDSKRCHVIVHSRDIFTAVMQPELLRPTS